MAEKSCRLLVMGVTGEGMGVPKACIYEYLPHFTHAL